MMTLHKACAFVITAMLFAGCATIDRQAALELSKQGESVATAAAQSCENTRVRLDYYLEGEYMLSALEEGYSPPGEAMSRSIKTVRDELSGRKRMFSELAALYSSFAALCSYGAEKEVQTSLKEMLSALSDYAKTSGAPRLPADSSDLIGSIGGRAVGISQRARIRRSSEKIKATLEEMLRLIENDRESESMRAIREEIARGRVKVAKALWKSGIVSAEDLLQDHAKTYGLSLNTTAARKIAADTSLSRAVGLAIDHRMEKEREAVGAAYDATIEAIKALISEHARVEKGESISIAVIQRNLVIVREYTEMTSHKQ